MRAAICTVCVVLMSEINAMQAPDHAVADRTPATSSPALMESGYAPVNGIRMYYEVHGRKDGIPLVLLHGGGSTIESTFGRVLPFLSEGRRIIALEEQGHGRTSDRDQPFSFEASADDVAALLKHLDVDTADILGFSNGASVALQLAIRHPKCVRKLIFASAFTKRIGAHPEVWAFIKQANISNMPQPLKDAFLKVTPDMDKLKAMHDKDATRMQTFRDVRDAAVRSVRAPTLIIMGDRDIATPKHTIELLRLFPNARLLVLPSGHGEYLGEVTMPPVDSGYPELTARVVAQFLAHPID
jgi:pimeloyl-ACP methyl ester carboxylesterase